MRPAWMIGSLFLVLVLGMDLRAESVPYDATVKVPEVEVRSGPSNKFYPTIKLRQGDKVRVIEEKEGGWLAIKPPEGSFSWIPTKLINHTGLSGVVLAPNTEVMAGSSLSNERPNAKVASLDRGTQVVILDNRHTYAEDGSGWLPIMPTAKELRYLPADAVNVPAPVQTTASAPPAAKAAESNVPAALSADPLWTQAEQAERAGNRAEAARLILELAKKTPVHEQQMFLYNKHHHLLQGTPSSVPPGYQPGRPSEAYYQGNGGADNRLIPRSNQTTQYVPAPLPPGTSQYTYVPENQRPPVGQAPPTGVAPPAAAAAAVSQWSGQGYLRAAPFNLDGKRAYAFESSQGLPRLYVTAVPGVNLETFVNRNVNLYGPTVYRGDVKTNYMTVSYVAPAP